MSILKFLNAPLLGYSTENHTDGKKIETGLMRQVSIGVFLSQRRVYRYGHVYIILYVPINIYRYRVPRKKYTYILYKYSLIIFQYEGYIIVASSVRLNSVYVYIVYIYYI